MTRVQIHYRLEHALDDALLTAVRDAQAVYGIERIVLAPTLDSLMVEYDATRFRTSGVTSVLRAKGLPVDLIVPEPVAPAPVIA